MKRVLLFLFLVLILVTSTGCNAYNGINFSNDNNEAVSKNNEYILSSETCYNFFSCSPNEVADTLTNSWVDGHFQSAAEDAKGNLILVLSDMDVKHWSDYIDGYFDRRGELAVSDGCEFLVSDDYKSIESYTKLEIYPANGFTIANSAILCGVKQMLNGENPNDWYVNIKMFDVETGILIKEVKNFPDDKLKVNKEDWERALSGNSN